MDARIPPSLPPAGGDGSPVARQADSPLWFAVGTLYRKWPQVLAITMVTALLAVGVALLLPRDYAGEARVLRAEGGGGLTSMLAQASGGLGRLLMGGGGGDYNRFLAILESRSFREGVIREFDLLRVYELEDKRYPMEAAHRRLDSNVEFTVALDYDYLSIVAYDRDAERAAAMANFMVNELNRVSAQLSSDNARQTRLAVEQRLNEARTDLDSVRLAMQAFQERHGIVELEAQAGAFMEGIALGRGRLADLEVRYQTLAQQYGPDNPQTQVAREALAAARRQERTAMSGGDALMPVAFRDLPAVSRQYAELMQEQMIQATIIENIYPIYEQSRFQERSAEETLQVLDFAVPADRPTRPSRMLIVLAMTLSGLMLGTLFVLGQAWLKLRHTDIAVHLQRSEEPLPRTTA